MKAVLVVDIPSDMPIEDTKALHITLFNGLFTKDLSISQQLRPLPQKESEKHREEIEDWTGLVYSQGWNACIDAITGETE